MRKAVELDSYLPLPFKIQKQQEYIAFPSLPTLFWK